MIFLRFSTNEELRTIVEKELSALGEEASRYLSINYYANTPDSPEGTYVYASKIGYHYVYFERWQETIHKITRELFEICFWALDYAADHLAANYECRHRVQGQDFRRLMFDKYLELLQSAGENYRKRGEIKVDEILKYCPYDDTGINPHPHYPKIQ